MSKPSRLVAALSICALHLLACGGGVEGPNEAASELVTRPASSPLHETGCLFVRVGDEVRFYQSQPGIIEEIGNIDADAPLSTPERMGWGWTRFTIPKAMLPESGSVVFELAEDPGLTFWHQPSLEETTFKRQSTEEGIAGRVAVTADQGVYLVSYTVTISCGQRCEGTNVFGPSPVPFTEFRLPD